MQLINGMLGAHQLDRTTSGSYLVARCLLFDSLQITANRSCIILFVELQNVKVDRNSLK